MQSRFLLSARKVAGRPLEVASWPGKSHIALCEIRFRAVMGVRTIVRPIRALSERGVRLSHSVCHLLFLNDLPEACLEKRAIRLTGCGLCHNGNTNLGSRSPLYRLILLSLLGIRSERVCLYRNACINCKSSYRPEGICFQVELCRKHSSSAMLIFVLVKSGGDPVCFLFCKVKRFSSGTASVSFARGKAKKANQGSPGSEEVVAMIWALNQGIAMQDETNGEMQRPSRASATHLLNERLYPLDTNDLAPTLVKIANLEKQFKKAQGLNSIPDIEDGYTEAAKLSLYGRTLSGIAATWYAKLEDTVKLNWVELAEAIVDQYSYNTQPKITTQDLEATHQNPTESFVEFVARWRAKATQHDMLQKLIVTPLFTFKSLHELGVQIEDVFNRGIIPKTSELTRKVFSGSTNDGSSTISKPIEINTVTTADPFSKPSLQTADLTRAQGRTFTPLYMSLTSALKILIERGYLKLLDPQPLPDPLPARHNPAKYYLYHQQRGHGTDRCYRLRHEVQNLIDNQTIASPQDPNDQVVHPHLNLIHILPSTYNPSIYITPAHLPKPEVFILDSMDLCMMDAFESSQSREPTTFELMKMIEDLQRTVADLASVLVPSSTT
ncbi:hypothetical protein HYC85_030793 [Camellia sinensis]|uniref:Retrotransposon gag domain-containing protein n=1 Tax=Camellia sinensis TaxID=4442 RepID=A0A7J7G1S8_CAMSI|nr:hypothetical protein HYC85_030793 [Camellia sinensis]